MPPLPSQPLIKMKPSASGEENPFPPRLQAVALQLFWEKGYRATSTRDIATALGIKQGSLYYYVKNKEDLLHAICYSALQHVMENVLAASEGASDPLDALRRILAAHLCCSLQQQRQFFVSIAEYRSLSADRVDEIKIFWRDYQVFFCDVLDQAKANNLVRRNISNKHLYFITISTVHWTVMWFHSADALTPEQLAPMYTQVLADGAASAAARKSGKLEKLLRQRPHIPLPPIDAGINLTHARLLDVASTLFARQGFSNTSIREIAKAVGIEKASLYHYLPGKDDLNFEISRNAHVHLCHGVQQALSVVHEPGERLYTLIVAHVTLLLQHQDWHATANEQLNALPKAHRDVIITIRDAYEAQVRQVLDDAQSAGLLRIDLTPKSLGMILLGMTTHIYPWYEPENDIPPSDLGHLIADLFLTGLRG